MKKLINKILKNIAFLNDNIKDEIYENNLSYYKIDNINNKNIIYNDDIKFINKQS